MIIWARILVVARGATQAGYEVRCPPTLHTAEEGIHALHSMLTQDQQQLTVKLLLTKHGLIQKLMLASLVLCSAAACTTLECTSEP